MEQPDPKTKVHVDQLSIDVPVSPNAIGKWTPEEQFQAYAKVFGEKKAEEQRKLAEEANKCNCGAEAKERHDARQEDRKPRRLGGHQHRAGCPKVRQVSGTRGLSPEAQRELYEARMKAAA